MKATLGQAAKLLSVFEDTPGEQVQALLASGLLADLRDGNLAEVNRDELRRLMGLKPHNSPLLESIGVITIAATPELVASERFVVGSNIRYVGENFKAWFRGKTEKRASKTKLRYERLIRSELDAPILIKLGGLAETTLAQIFALIEQQKNGEAGVLLNNGWANIFYVKDARGTLRAVNVHWYVDGWCVNAYSVAHPHGWGDGDRVFSRNS